MDVMAQRSSKPARRKIQLNIKIIEGDPAENQVPLVLIEGDEATFVFLGNFILAHATLNRKWGSTYTGCRAGTRKYR